MESADLTLAQLRPIIFEGHTLPASVMAISLLAPYALVMDRELGAWLLGFPDCRDTTRAAPSLLCFTLAGKARDLMLDERANILDLIDGRFAAAGAEAKVIYGEWITSLQKISELAAKTDEECEWYAPSNPGESAIENKQLAAMKRYIKGSE
jgi:hypothetical protein